MTLSSNAFRIFPLLLRALELEHEVIPEDIDSDDYKGIIRWSERIVHWDNTMAITREIEYLEGKVVTLAEVTKMCAHVNSWITQLENALAYAQDYRKDSPDFASRTQELNILEETAQESYKMSLQYRSHCRSL